MNEDDAARRLRDAVDARMASVPDGDGDSLDAIRARVAARRSSRVPVFIAVAAAAAVLVGAAIVLTRHDTKTRVIVPAGSSSSVEPTTSAPQPIKESVAIRIWPLAGTAPFATPEDAAVSFARDYLGFGDPIAHPTTDTIEVTPNGDAGPRTTVDFAAEGNGFVVTGARSDQVAISSTDVATDGTTHVAGTSVAFEAQIVLQLRPFGSVIPAASTTAMGGSTEPGPFAATIPGGGPGIVVAYSPDASGRGTAIAASVAIVGTAPFDARSFDGTIVARTPEGAYVNVTSGPAVPAGEEAFAAVHAASTAHDFAAFGDLATLCSPTEVAVVLADGRTVKRIDFVHGSASMLFTAPHTITSLDANVLGGLLFTDDQTGLWRWDGPGQGPVEMTTGYVDAAW